MSVTIRGEGAVFACPTDIRHGGVKIGAGGALHVANTTLLDCRGAVPLIAVGNGTASSWRNVSIVRLDGTFAFVEGTLSISAASFLNSSGTGEPVIAALSRGARVDFANVTVASALVSNSMGGLFQASDTSSLTLSACTLRDVILSNGYGGVLWAGGTSAISIADTIIERTSASRGGVFYISDSANLGLESVRIVGATSSFSGGTTACEVSGRVVFRNVTSVASACGSGFGGFVDVFDDCRFNMTDSHVEGSQSAVSGGALWSSGAGVSYIDNVDFANTAAAGIGGAIGVSGQSSAYLSRVRISNASAEYGGCIYMDNFATLIMRSSTVSTVRTGAYGAIITLGSPYISLEDVEFSAMRALSGGFVYLSGTAKLVASRCRLSGVGAALDGGGFFVSGGAGGVLKDSTFRDIATGGNGGFAFVEERGSLVVERCAFANVSAVKSGGALYARGATSVSLRSLDFFATACGGRGGMLSGVEFAVIDVRDSTLKLSSAGAGAGAAGGNATSATSSSASDKYLNSFAGFSGGAISVEDSVAITVNNVTATRVSAAGAGGFMVATGRGVSAVVGNVSVANARAYVGGAFVVGLGASLSLVDVGVNTAVASADGGCVYVAGGSTILFGRSVLQNCFAGAVRSTFGAGGAIYLGPGIRGGITSATHASNVSAVLGPGIYSYGVLPATALVHANVSDEISIDKSEIPSNWESGGLLVGAVSRLASSVSAVTVQTGSPLPPFELEIRDVYGGRVSLPADQNLAIRVRLSSEGGKGVVATGVYLVGDVEKNFATAAFVRFSGLRLFAPAGNYALRAESSNPFLYGDLDLDDNRCQFLRTFSLNVTVAHCEMALLPLDGDASQMAWQCVASDGSSNTVRVVVPSVLGSLVLLVAIAVLVRWRWVVDRRERSKMAQAEFVKKHAAALVGLAKFEVPRSSTEVLDKLGEGEFGVVMKARLFLNDRARLCAAKALKEGATYAERVAYVEEAQILADLNHPNVISLCGVVTVDEPMYILFEFAAHGDLRTFVSAITGERRAAAGATGVMLGNFASQIARGMAYLASVKVVHRDLAARNCLVSQDVFGEYVVKVADFGLSRITRAEYFRNRGARKERLPYRWMAPEAISTLRFTEKTDVWSFGVCVWEMYSFGAVPYAGVPSGDILSHVSAGKRLEFTASNICSAALRSVVARCWEKAPEDRPRFEEIERLCAAALQTSRVPASPARFHDASTNGRQASYLNLTVPAAETAGPSTGHEYVEGVELAEV